MATGDRDYLVERARGGDRKALEELFETNLDIVYGFVAVKLGANDSEIEDVVHEVFIGALGSAGRFRGGNEAAFAGWLLGIARYKVADHFRKQYASKVDFLEDTPGAAAAGAGASPEDIVTEQLDNQALRAALADLTPDQEEVLTLKFILGYDTDQVAQITGRPVGAVRALQHRALATLRRRLRSDRSQWN